MVATYSFFLDRPVPQNSWGKRLVIRRSMTVHQIFQEAQRQGIYAPLWVWRLSFLRTCAHGPFYAGYYTIQKEDSVLHLVCRLHSGRRDLGKWVIIEGSDWRTLTHSLAHLPDVIQDTQGQDDRVVLDLIGDHRHFSLEGIFFPSTYAYVPGERASAILRRAYQKMMHVLTSIWAQRDLETPLHDPYSLLILSSLIEKEVHLEHEKGQVASVFYNRLRKKMLLQTDPTVYYAAQRSYHDVLQPEDLARDSPHNTYRYAGLPPTPICFPSLSSLMAAAHPIKTSYYYFVARGDGSSYFSHSLRQHSRAIHRFLDVHRNAP